jgi:FemAB-related protein (PEP-CTERM system-associated)
MFAPSLDVDQERAGGGAERSLTVQEAAPADRIEWDTFVSARSDASGYHEWGWRNVITETFGHDSTYLIARSDGTVRGVLPLVEMRSLVFGHFLTSLPFVNYGGVLADSESTARALAAAAAQLGRTRGCRHVELRHVGRKFADVPVRQHKVTMRLPIALGMWERFDRKVRNQIRKAEKSNLVAERGGVELVGDFYTVFARNMRDLGTPVYSKRLFENVIAAFPSRAQLIVVRHEGRPVAGGLTYRTRHTTEVPWASSLREFNSLCPNHLLYWRAIESAVADGCDLFDFGRSTPHEGTYNFKSQWGAMPVALNWEYPYLSGAELPDQGPSNPKFQLAVAAWKRCPLWFANLVGPRIVRAIP